MGYFASPLKVSTCGCCAVCGCSVPGKTRSLRRICVRASVVFGSMQFDPNTRRVEGARRELYERAREITLSPEDAQRVREMTLEQVEAIVQRIVGEKAAVQVAYQQEWGR